MNSVTAVPDPDGFELFLIDEVAEAGAEVPMPPYC
jgi:hypothetical protein